MNFESIEYLWKTDASAGGNCPALYRVDGGYVVQGKKLGRRTRRRLRDLGRDETGLFVPADVIERIRAED
jgi:hypothetical protein